MLKHEMTMLILSCDHFSDLWEGHLKMLEKNWPDREMETFIVTEENTDFHAANVQILAAGSGKEWSERLHYALSRVQTEYVFITLDDYYLLQSVDTQRIKTILDMMNHAKVDYVRLFPHPRRATGEPFLSYAGMHTIDTSLVYSVNLYSGIWRKSSLEKMIDRPQNAWQFEVSLAQKARKNAARCVVSNNQEFIILDVVRKGKLLRKAARYFKRHPGIYDGDRAVNTWFYEFRLWVQTMISRHAPRCIFHALRSLLISWGFHFYSQDADEET